VILKYSIGFIYKLSGGSPILFPVLLLFVPMIAVMIIGGGLLLIRALFKK